MKKVVMDKPKDTIRPEEVTDKQIVVKSMCNILSLLVENGYGSETYSWRTLGYVLWRNPVAPHYGSIRAAITDVLEAGDEVFVLSSLHELADWIRDNAGRD